MEEDRLIDSELDEEEVQYDNKLRPDKLTEYIGPVSYTHLTLPTNREV